MENLTNWCVYMHENRINGKKYIGITSHKPTRRWGNGKNYEDNAHFHAAICKYGWDGFRHEILYTDLTQAEAERLEVELIKKYQTQDPDKGYNIAAGGLVNAGFHRSEEFKRKVSAARTGVYSGPRHNMYGKPKSKETKERIRAAQTGIPKSEASRQRMVEGAKRRWDPSNKAEREHLRILNLGGNSARAVKIRCVETGEVYEAIRDAARLTGIDSGSITRCCKGERATAGGFHWSYVEEVVGE